MENRVHGPADMDLRTLRHDLRAPIANVIALAEMTMHALEREEAQAQILPNLSKILLAARELAKMTGEPGAQKAQRFTAGELAQTLGATIGAQAAEKGQLLEIDVSALGGGAMIAERTAITRILTNLLANAVKYTQKGGRIRLTARRSEGEKEEAQAVFVVEDNGMGMDAAFMERMYEPFARAPEAAEGESAGCGLGLSIVRKLTKQMGGEIAVRSEPGRGTAFTLRLPVRFLREEGAALRGKRILLAEDSDLSAEIAGAMLRRHGAQVCRAADGRQAVKTFMAEPVGAFDAILLDMRMPELSGCGAAKAIRASDRADAGYVPILALTAGGDAQDEREAISAGMNACLKKPLDIGELCRVMGLRKESRRMP